MSLFKRQLGKRGKIIFIETRNEKIFNGRSSEVFTNPVKAKALVCTVTGITTFDDTNTEQIVTHELRMNYITGVSSEKWVRIEKNGKRYKVLSVENCCEDDAVLILQCTERGLDSKVVNDA